MRAAARESNDECGGSRPRAGCRRDSTYAAAPRRDVRPFKWSPAMLLRLPAVADLARLSAAKCREGGVNAMSALSTGLRDALATAGSRRSRPAVLRLSVARGESMW